jgi:zinc protease
VRGLFLTRLRIVLPFVIVLIVCGLPGAAAIPKQAPPTRTILDNGLEIIVAERHTAEIVTLQAWVKVGSRDETDALSGAAHFVEHMLFKGTTRRKAGQIDREVEGFGAVHSASTGFDSTRYFLSAASRFFDQILDIQADMLMNSVFDSTEFERERSVIIEELNLRVDTPAIRTFDLLYTTAYTVHPYRRLISGSRENVQRMTRDQVFGFYRDYYVPASVVIVVVGDVSTADVLTKVRRTFGTWRGAAPVRPPVPAEPPMTTIRRTEVAQDIRVATFRMGWVGPAVHNPDNHAMDILAYVLGQGRASRLVQQVRERRRLAQEIDASFLTAHDPALFDVFAVADPQDLSRAQEAILEEIAAVRDEGVADGELQRAKMLLEGETIVNDHTSRGLAESLGSAATIAELEFALTYLDRIREVTSAEVQRVAKRYLDPLRYAIAVVRPQR